MKAVIIGANRGIGLGLVKQYLRHGWEVIAVCRAESEQLSSLQVDSELTIISGIDVTKEQDRQQLREALPSQIDQLIHNAGILRRDSLRMIDEKAIIEQFIVNALSPLQTIQQVYAKLNTGGKIGIITSRMGSIEDNTSGGMYGYRMSKAAVNMVGKGLAEDLKDTQLGVYLLHPGYVQTDMTGGQGYITVEQSSAGLYQRMQELSFSQTGTFWHTDGTQLTW